MVTHMLSTILVVGLAAGGLAVFTRALPWPPAWKNRKPLGCPGCLAGHAAWMAYGYAVFLDVLPWRGIWWFGAYWLTITGVSVCVVGVSGVLSGFDAVLDGGADVRPADGGAGTPGVSAEGSREV